MKRAERQPVEEPCLYGDVYVKSVLVPDAGTVLPQHAHTYDHISYLAAGAVMVELVEKGNGAVWQHTYVAPYPIRIRARGMHKFTTLVSNTLILCIHNAAHGEAADIHEEHHLALED